MAETRESSKKNEISTELLREITSGELSEGDSLPSVRALAEQYDTSLYTVQSALKILEEDGYVETKHGRGSFIADTTPEFTVANNVALCLRPRAHFFAPLTTALTNALVKHQASPMVVDMSGDESERMMRSMARGGVRFFVVHGNMHFPFGLLDDRFFEDKWIISVLEWAGSERDNLLRVLSDFQAGGRKAARHLWDKGHRRALVVGTETNLWLLDPHHSAEQEAAGQNNTVGFVREWERLGGRWQTLCSHTGTEGDDTYVWLDKEELLEVFDETDEMPTAVFGFRDVEAARVQQGLQKWRPELVDQVDVVGYYDTPWSQGAHPPLDTFSLRIDRIAEHVAEMVELVLKGEPVDNCRRVVEPELIVR